MLIAILQFIWSGSNRSIKEMWIIIAITIGVYAVLYAIETLWNFASLSPPLMDQAKTAQINGLGRHRIGLEENLKELSLEVERRGLAWRECEKKLAEHPVIQQEKRQLDLVQSKLRDVTPEERHVLLFILDHGKISRFTIDRQLSTCKQNIRDAAIGKGMNTGLIMEELIPASPDKYLYIAPALEAALKTVLASPIS